MGIPSTDPTRRGFLGGVVVLGLVAALPACGDDDAPVDRAGTSTEPAAGLDLPVNDTAELRAIFDPRFEPLGQRVTRIGLYDLTDGFDPSDTGDHLAIYVEPIDAEGAGWDDARYIETAAAGMAAATPFAFAEWADLNSVDVCQEPPQSANAAPEPPIETQLLVDRETSGEIDWDTVELSDLIAARDRAPDAVTIAARQGLEEHPLWMAAVEAAAEQSG
jgi:hypothetical protein